MENIIPRLPPGEIVVGETAIKFVRKNGGSETVFPKEALYYLQCFAAGKSVKTIVEEGYANKTPVNFANLKETLVTLYWSHNLQNKKEFKRKIENSDWIPVNESTVLKPIFEFEFANQNILIQFTLFILPLALVALCFLLLTMINPNPISLVLFPMAFLTVKGLASTAFASILRKGAQRLSLHISTLGLYLRESSIHRSASGSLEFILNSVLIWVLSGVSAIYFLRSDDLVLRIFGPILSLFMMCLLFSPSHKTDLSNFYLGIQDEREKKNIFKKLLLLASVSLFFTVTLIYLGLFLSVGLKIYENPEQKLLIAYGIVTLITLTFLFDLLDDLDFLIDQMSQALNFKLKEAKEKLSVPELIKNVPLFQTLQEDILGEMTKHSQVIQVKAGVSLFREGQLSTDLYFIISGRVGIFKIQNRRKVKILDLPKGNVFGEGGFFLGRPRMAEAITLATSKILWIKRPPTLVKHGSIPAASASGFQKKIWAFQSLVQSKMFKEVPSELLMSVVTTAKVLDFPPDHVLIKEGSSSDCIWIIIEGHCEALSGEMHKSEMHIGSVFGEIGVIWMSKRTTSVVTRSPSTLLRIDAGEVWKILGSNLDFGVALQALGTERLS